MYVCHTNQIVSTINSQSNFLQDETDIEDSVGEVRGCGFVLLFDLFIITLASHVDFRGRWDNHQKTLGGSWEDKNQNLTERVNGVDAKKTHFRWNENIM